VLHALFFSAARTPHCAGLSRHILEESTAKGDFGDVPGAKRVASRRSVFHGHQGRIAEVPEHILDLRGYA
jgi:hypothetical protein